MPKIARSVANSADPDQTPLNAAFDLGFTVCPGLSFPKLRLNTAYGDPDFLTYSSQRTLFFYRYRCSICPKYSFRQYLANKEDPDRNAMYDQGLLRLSFIHQF